MTTPADAPPLSADVIVYGGTPCGIAAACSAAERGASVLLIEPTPFLGGHSTSGVCTTESEHMLPISFSGWLERFLRRLGQHYGIDGPLHRWEPKVAKLVFSEMLVEAGVRTLLKAPLASVEVAGGQVRALALSDGRRVEGRVFIDASYEGDLLAGAGVPWTVGREARHTYDEPFAGIRFIEDVSEATNTKGHALKRDEIWEIDLRDGRGGLIDGVIPAEGIVVGEGDRKVMNYHYRVTVSKGDDRIPVPRPPHYREERFALLARWLHGHPETRLAEILGFLRHPTGNYHLNANGKTVVEEGDKYEINNHQAAILSLGHFGGQFGYPEGTPEERAAIIADHYEHNAGLLYFLAHSSDVPTALREEMRGWGLPPDEYPDNHYWPYQPYVRECRRMQGALILTQRDVLEDRHKDDVIFWNSHWIDCHHVQRLALDEFHFRNEGRIWKELLEPYAIPWRALLPRGEDATNLIVPGCVSASHVAFCSIRLESTWMGLGEAAGVGAVQALAGQRTVQEIDVSTLQKTLRERGVNLPDKA